MAETNPAPKKQFQMVTTNYKVAGGALRSDAAITIYPSGRAICNRSATDILDDVAGTPAESFLVKFGVDAESKTVAVYLANANDKGAMRVRRYSSRGGTRLSFHMGGVWQEHPRLRPDSGTEFLVTKETDQGGTLYMEISLQAGQTERKTANAEPTAQTQRTAAADQNPK